MLEQRVCVSPMTNTAFTSRLNAECRLPVSSGKISSMTIVAAKRSETSSGQKLAALTTELFNLRFSHATGQLANPMQIQNVRRDIARVKTVIRERELRSGKEAK